MCGWCAGGVIVFANIVILYACISLWKIRYMARAAFIMDKVMHKNWVAWQVVYSSYYGFGCNVPAILATHH